MLGERLPVVRVEEVEHGEGPRRVRPTRRLERRKEDGAELASGGGVLGLDAPELGDGLLARVAQGHVPLGAGRVTAAERLDERPLGVVAATAARLRRGGRRRGQQGAEQRRHEEQPSHERVPPEPRVRRLEC